MSSSNPTYYYAPTGGGSVFGDEFANVVIGSDFNDYMAGWEGHDTLEGGFGDDTLEGGTGDDLLTGGTGFDRFEFRVEEAWDAFGPIGMVGFGQDVITDFSDGDMLEITGWGTGGLDLTVAWTATDTILTVGAGTQWHSSIVLEDHLTNPLGFTPSQEFFIL